MMAGIEALGGRGHNGMMEEGTNVRFGDDGEVDWDGAYVAGEIPWDKGEAAPPLVAHLEGNEVGGRVLVPGCGLGHDVRVLAGQGAAEVVGLDVSATAVKMADAVGKSGTERYVLGDLFDLEEGMRGYFDWVFEHTCFCAIDPSMRNAYVEAVHEALKPGGKILGVFFLDPYDEEHQPGQGPPHGATVEEIEGLFGERFELLESWVPGAAYEGRAGLEWGAVFRRKN
ncbi:MAG: methyltransferase domain-containing protein [Verrucomicrobiota bacterium]